MLARRANTLEAPRGHDLAHNGIVPCAATVEAGPESFSLEAALAYAMQNNPRLREAAANAQVAREAADVTFAAFFPEFNAAYRYAFFNLPVIPGGSFVIESLNGGASNFGIGEVGGEWTLYDFGRRRGLHGQAQSETRLRELSEARARQTVAFNVARGYFRLLLARAVRAVRLQALEQARAILDDTRARRKGGVVDREAVLRAEVEVAQAEKQLLAARQSVRDAESTLNLAMGRPVTLPIHVDDVAAQPDFAGDLDACVAQAVETRPEAAAARELIVEGSYGVQAARGEMGPRVFVRGSVVRADSPSDSVRGWVTGVGLHVLQPLYAGGKHQSAVRQQQARIASANAALQAVLDLIAQQVNVAFQAIDTRRQQIRLGVKEIEQARENLRQVVVRYRNGNATPTDVVDAQTALVQAQTSYYQATYDYLDALAQLDHAMGGDQARLLERLAEETAPVPARDQ